MGDVVRARWALGSAVLLAAGLLPLPSLAQQALVLEEVVVTAQRKEESIQDAPLSVVAYNTEDLEKLSVNSLMDLNARVPNLSLTPFATASSTIRLHMRGVGPNDVQLTQDPSVALYLNQVYIARSTGLALDVADLERIEVLRGPQGTLYGRNATGGAVNLITAAPELDQWQFRQQVTLGNYDKQLSKTTVNMPLGENMAAKLAYLYHGKSGFIDNDGPGADFGDRVDRGMRLDLLWQPGDTLTASYAYDYANTDIVNTPPQSAVSSLLGPESTLTPISAPASSRVNHQTGRLDSFSTTAPMRTSHVEVEGHALSLEWEASDNMLVKYIAAYRSVDERNYADLVASIDTAQPAYLLGNGGERVATVLADPLNGGEDATYNLNRSAFNTLEQSQVSHELNVFGDINDNLSYIAGVYYFRERGSETSPRAQQIILDEGVPLVPGVSLDLLVLNESDVDIENSAWSAFGEFYYRPEAFDGRLELTLGYRHSEDEREADRVQNQNSYTRLTAEGNNPYADPVPGLDISVVGSPSRDFTNDSFTAIAKYDWNDYSNSYIKVAQGYKTGGFNTRSPTTELFLNGFDQENLISYELGFKGDLLERRLRVNAAVFYVDYDDIQMNLRTPQDPTLTDVINAGKANITGLELDVTALLTQDLTASLQWGNIYTDFDEVLEANAEGEIVNAADDYVFANAPRNSVSASLDYVAPWVERGELLFSLNYRYRSSTPVIAQEDWVRNPENGVAGAYASAYRIFDARIAWNDVSLGGLDGTFSLAAWGKNLLDEDYVLDAYLLPHSFGVRTWGEPRTYGIDMIYRYQ